MVKRIFMLLIAIVLIITPMSVFATDNWPTVPPTSTQNEETNSGGTQAGELSPIDGGQYVSPTIPGKDSVIGEIDEARKVYAGYADVMPVVSTNDILRWATTKGNEIIYFLQIMVQPITVIIFIIAALITLVGSIGRGDMVGKGLWGMIISLFVYAAVLYAPVILQTFVGWVAS